MPHLQLWINPQNENHVHGQDHQIIGVEIIETEDEDHAIDDQGHETAIEVEIEDHDREIDQSLVIVTAQNQEIDQPIRHEIDLDQGTGDPNHVTVHDPALDREHEQSQEIRMIMLEMQRFAEIIIWKWLKF